MAVCTAWANLLVTQSSRVEVRDRLGRRFGIMRMLNQPGVCLP
jgi:hypothetical protein